MKIMSRGVAKRTRLLFEQRHAIFLNAVKEKFKELSNDTGPRGHGPDHDLLVGGYGILISGGDLVLSEKVWIASMLHSIDRFAGENAKEVIQNLMSYLDSSFGKEIDKDGREEILSAVLRHDQPNADDDNSVQVVLQDADRLANAGPIVLIRCGQHRKDIPALDIGFLGDGIDPRGDFNRPASCLDDIKHHFDWESHPRFGLRTEAGKKLAKKYFKFLREFLRLVRYQYKEAGIVE